MNLSITNGYTARRIDVMAVRSPEHDAGIRVLRELVGTLGFSHVVYLLAQVADEQGDVAKAHDDATGAIRAAHDAKVLGDAAIRLLD